MKSRDHRLAARATLIHGLHCGQPPRVVAEVQQVSLSKVYATWWRYRAGGIEGLKNRPVSGRPRKVTEAFRSELEAVLSQPPAALGYEFTVWTAERLRLHLKTTTGIEVCEATLLNTLRELGYVYRRPKKDLSHRQDPADRERFRERLEELKRGRETAISAYSLWTKAASNSISRSTPAG